MIYVAYIFVKNAVNTVLSFNQKFCHYDFL